MQGYAARHGRVEPVDGADHRELVEAAQAWLDDDPDEDTRAELGELLGRATTGDAEAVADLADRFAGMLEFGTAGLRGALGAGPNRMNRAVVIRAAAGLTAYLRRTEPEPLVVIGFDARTGSDVFARDTAAVVVGAGGRAAVLPRPLPTPVLAFAIRHLGADAGVMVTASHNPARDNGYKVYLGDGSQIVPPTDGDIAGHIARVREVADVPRAQDGWQTLGEDVLEAYLDATAGLLAGDGPRELRVVHTALHGVGGDTLRAVFERAGFEAPHPVPAQADPDPAFPTVDFPNPEEPGAIDAALALAQQVDADLVLANDPDADRCAVAVRDDGRWRMLHGDEVGALLAAHILDRGVGADEVLACSIVSSRLLGAMARHAGVGHVETLTGFKWIARVPGLRYGYEEALGYCVDPATVRDKDGISAALLVAEMAAGLKAIGSTLPEVLDLLAVEHGLHATEAFSVRVPDIAHVAPVMARLRAEPPGELAGTTVSQWDDLAAGVGPLPPTDGVRFFLGDGSRVVVRPSGTEPKLKVYLEVVEPVEGFEALPRARASARARLAALTEAMRGLTAL